MKRIRLITAFVALLNVLCMWADGASLKLHFNFENVTGGNVQEVISEGNIVGTLMNNAKVVTMGKYHVLDLGSGNGYFDMGEATGKVLAACSDFSISMYYYVDSKQDISGLGNFLFTFSNDAACTQTTGKYYFYTLNAQRLGSSSAGYGSEKSVNASKISSKGSWVNVVYVQKGTTGTLYINGSKTATATSNTIYATFGKDAPTNNWIGRSPFTGDTYLGNTKVADIRIYDGALTGAEIAKLGIAADDYEHEFRHGTQGDLTTLNATLQEASELLNGDASIYTADAISILSDTYETIKAKSEKETLSQIAIDEYATGLKTAIQNVKITQGLTFTDTELMPTYDTNRGFRHPGGLHTDADFERIKAQLAAGNEKVTKAYNVLKSSVWAQPDCATWPVETVIRGEGTQNYINAARGAAIAYQNGLRWKIEGNEACAKHAVDVLNQWASTCKGIGGNSNYALAAGLYGYEFAQAAELVRDYTGWNAKDFEKFKRWMLDVWYPSSIGFQRGRNGTWENTGNKPNAGWGTAGDRPGHYWSNWGLCNTLCLVSIGILCDDVFIYNQGLSFMKYDLAALTASCPGQKRTETDIWNNGLTEYIDNLIPNVADYAEETGAYGKVGQMQESGRDQGHATMALGLAVDICQTAWNQGDDLYSYHDNRMAAGIEFTAALNNDGKTDLPWVTYHYADCRTAWHNAWAQSIALGSQTRPYWGRIIGHYEGIKGVKMPFAEKALEALGIDGGPAAGAGESGAYDHLGFSVLTNTYDSIADEQHRPTLLSPKMEYEGYIIEHNELGGLESTYLINTNMGVPTGKQVKLMPQLPTDAADTGNWEWNTGEKTRNITVTTDKSYLYRVTYTNKNGIKSEQVFAIASQGDCTPTTTNSSIYVDGTWMGATEATVANGSNVTLNVGGASGWGEGKWSTGQSGTSITLPSVTKDREVKGQFISQGGLAQTITFHIHVEGLTPCALMNNRLVKDTLEFVINKGDNLILFANAPKNVVAPQYSWSNGTIGKHLDLSDISTTGSYTLHITGEGFDEKLTYHVMVVDENYVNLPEGNYAIYDIATDTYLTYEEGAEKAKFTSLKSEAGRYETTQVWKLAPKVSKYNIKYNIISLVGGNTPFLAVSSNMVSKTYYSYSIRGLIGSDHVTICSSLKNEYWKVSEDGELDTKGLTSLTKFPLIIIPVKDDQITTDISSAETENCIKHKEYYNVAGIKTHCNAPGIYIQKTTDCNGKTIAKKISRR